MRHSLPLTGATALLLLGLVSVSRPAGAQQGERSPHGGLAIECAVCHAPASWTAIRIGKGFDHARIGFPLSGAHGRTTCRSCHASLDFKGAPVTCAACHEDVHRGELGADCARCHTPRAFLDRTAMVQAHTVTRFPLDGSHLLADCRACHAPAPQGRLTFVGRPTRCEDCHLTSYATTTNPNHRSVGFSTDCTSCHSTLAWERARFDHGTAGFPLTGAHATLTCDQCHKSFQFTGTPAACLTCHQRDYEATTDPAHAAAGIPTDCASCHGTLTWQGARFDHDGRWFPIYSGEHRGKWSSCSDCHTVSSDFTQFTCVRCHRQTDMDSRRHRTIAGYGPTPADCLRCHARGGGGG